MRLLRAIALMCFVSNSRDLTEVSLWHTDTERRVPLVSFCFLLSSCDQAVNLRASGVTTIVIHSRSRAIETRNQTAKSQRLERPLRPRIYRDLRGAQGTVPSQGVEGLVSARSFPEMLHMSSKSGVTSCVKQSGTVADSVRTLCGTSGPFCHFSGPGTARRWRSPDFVNRSRTSFPVQLTHDDHLKALAHQGCRRFPTTSTPPMMTKNEDHVLSLYRTRDTLKPGTTIPVKRNLDTKVT